MVIYIPGSLFYNQPNKWNTLIPYALQQKIHTIKKNNTLAT